MFYSHTILARKSPLGTVWIAAHLERKIKKPQIDGIDIPSYAESIMFPEVPIALRLSGHLLLGLVRIYSWKVNYLFQDCNRMVTTIRTAFASVQVDLPVGADHAPFESITLPATLNLDDLDLDDALSQLNTPDNNHQKTLDQITLSDEREYVMIDLDAEVGLEPPVQEPIAEVASKNANEEIHIYPSPGNVPLNFETTTVGAQDPPEKMRDGSGGPILDFPEIITNEDDDPMDVDPSPSPFVQKKIITSPVIEEPFAGQQLPGTSVPSPQTLNTFDPFEDVHLPDWGLQPSPSQVQVPPQVQDPHPPQARGNKRIKFDSQIVSSNEYMSLQISDENRLEKFVDKRKLPQTSRDMWKFSKVNKNGSFFREPLLAVYDKNFPRVGDHDAEGASHESEAADGNNDHQDALPERQPSPMSPVTADAQPEPLPTPKSPRLTAAQGNYMSPELPRFSPVHMPSAAREDDSPFKTRSQTPLSRLWGTGCTETPSDGNYSLPGQSTAHSMASLFPIIEDEDLPEIPGLISTPGGGSSVGTGVTGLGSMSARTR
ncbi:hypothetical protein PR202_ga27789 [Eleusine coracana subsp. coracana]|uniref:Rad21/Rec8-like protein N-terminal domain-containing protein n=1 Tax=Eleusine coracana subsp. coracana TaxID=191504 RepID=A0AAV5DHW1_ELECO|nr:hypothetical protein PR202_ga27789 [Eleusine coracana subsp. coracana]